MDQMTYKGVLLSFSILIGLGLAAPALASGDYYVNADSAAKSDDNACLSKSAPCATLGGVIGQILASAHPEDSTIYAKGNFDEQLDISDSALEGLTVTWLEQGVQPVINGAGLNYGVSVYQVDGVSLKHLNVIGSNYASIYVYGGSSSHIRRVNIENCTVESADADATSHTGIYVSFTDDVVVKGNRVKEIGSVSTNLDAFPDTTGIHVLEANRVQIINNHVHDFVADTTFTDEVSYTYAFVSGIYVYKADEVTIKGNQIKDLVANATNGYSSGTSYAYAYAVYAYDVFHSSISRNTIRRVQANAVGVEDSVTSTASTAGLYVTSLDEVSISHNKILNSQASTTVQDTEGGQAIIYGLYMDTSGDIGLTHNKVRHVSATVNNGAGVANTFGLVVNDIQQLGVVHNVFTDITAVSHGTNTAETVGMKFINAPETNVANNRLGDFTAGGEATTENNSYGIILDYNSHGDILNNFIYFTDADMQSTIDGIQVNSVQADPVHIFHNTMNNLRTCLDIADAAVLEFENNICQLNTSGSFGVSVDSEEYDLTQLISNYNIFYNSVEPVQMNDTATGVMSFSDWKSGDYLQDGNSLKQNPKLNVSDPAKKGYLHLKSGSPAIEAGMTSLDFDEDDEMNQRLLKDWDNDPRPTFSSPDVGADEVTEL